jgi:transposase
MRLDLWRFLGWLFRRPLRYNVLMLQHADSPTADLVRENQALRLALESSQAKLAALSAQVTSLARQVDWFKRQLFGPKSERRLIEVDPTQLSLGEGLLGPPPADAPRPTTPVPAHSRSRPSTDAAAKAGAELDGRFFDEAKVPVETIEVEAPQTRGLAPEAFEIIDHKTTYRLAQRPGSYVVLAYRRPVVKLKTEGTLVCPPAPLGVIENSRADVSFLVGLILDKLLWHLPLYRQHQRLLQAGLKVSRSWLTQLIEQACALLDPVIEAQLQSILKSRVLSMDETPIKAGRSQTPGKMQVGHVWPLYGDQDEVHFHYAQSRGAKVILDLLKSERPQGAILLSDGYSAYECYLGQVGGSSHALCWAHTRRKFFEARAIEPDLAAEALERIGQIYAVEETIRQQKLKGDKKHLHRFAHSKPVVTAFFEWALKLQAQHGLLPSNPFLKALNYALERREGLQVFLVDPEVPIDTNHVERAIRPITLGRKNWLFCWTELGAERLAALQSLVYTCKLQGIDPYTYLVDVLQRISQHPASRVQELIPRLWKQHFADNPLRAPLDPEPA